MTFFEKYKNGWLLRVKLAPGASSKSFRGVFIDENGTAYLKIAVTSIPEKGKANLSLIKFLAKTLAISRSSIELLSGETEHLKRLYIKLPVSPETEKQLASLEEK